MKWLKLICTLLVFFVDVRVHAALAYHKLLEPVQEPRGCLQEQIVCAVSTFDKSKYDLTVGSSQIILGGRTTVLRNDADLVTLISGEIWVRANGRIKIQSEFGAYEIDRGEAWVIRENGKMLVRTVSGTADLTPRGGEALPIPPGFEMWVTGVGPSGIAQTAIPRAIDFKDHMRRWARLFPGNRMEFKKEVTAFRDVWVESVEKASTFHFSIVQRNIASETEAQQQKTNVLEQIKKENQRLRTLFRKKLSFED